MYADKVARSALMTVLAEVFMSVLVISDIRPINVYSAVAPEQPLPSQNCNIFSL
jgi:hypothetical protein